MTDQKRLVLDANILLRAVFGVRVRSLLESYEDSVSFYAPDICFTDARKYIPSISEKRGRVTLCHRRNGARHCLQKLVIFGALRH